MGLSANLKKKTLFVNYSKFVQYQSISKALTFKITVTSLLEAGTYWWFILKFVHKSNKRVLVRLFEQS